MIGAAIMISTLETSEITEELKAPSEKIRSGRAGAKARAENLSVEERAAIA
ncbi:MAG: hypothetical protein ACREDT_08675 [Methylocella sp.]